MQEEIRDLDGFPGYGISNLGYVVNDRYGRPINSSVNQMGILHVALYVDGRQHRRSVAVLVASTFLPEPTNPKFDTPMHLDGDRLNCAADNLILRPRWFVIKYHQQFREVREPYIPRPIHEIKTGLVFDTSMHAAKHYGLLDKDIFLAVMNNTVTPTTYQQFEVVE